MLHLILALCAIRLGLFMMEAPHQGFTRAITGLLLFLLVWAGIKASEHMIFEHKGTRFVSARRFPMFFRDIVRFVVLVFVVIVLLKTVFKVDPSALVVTSTVVSAIVGLALQDMLSNIVAGVALQIERPFGEGHWLRLGDQEGQVLQMSWRATHLRTREGDILTVPNGTLANAEILNFHQGDSQHMIRQIMGVSYDSPPDQVKAVLLSVMHDVEGVLDIPEPDVHTVNYGDFSVDYEMRFWIEDYGRAPAIRDQVMTRLWYALARANMDIPFPVRHIQVMDREGVERNALVQEKESVAKIVRQLASIDFLQALDSSQLQELARQARVAQYGTGEYLVHQGHRDAALFFIEDGTVVVSAKSLDGKTGSNIGQFGAGYFFGEIALLTGAPRTASVVAMGHVRAVIIDKAALEPLLKEKPELAVTLSEVLRERSEELEKLLHQATDEKHQEAHEVGFLERIQRFFEI